jgi:geranylgeranyl pyrophosphate synthase
MVLLAGESVGGEKEKLQKLALAVELLHSASLVHDDVLDRDVFRRNALSAQAKWGVREAVLVGDALASLALMLCKGYPQEVLDLMVDTCLQLSDGEFMDLETTRNVFSEPEYLVRVKKKTASLFRAASQCGALAAEGSFGEVEALGIFGENYGIAFQIRDDLVDGAEPGEFRVTLPIIRFYQNAGKKDRVFLESLVSKRLGGSVSGNADGDFRMKLDKCGAVPYCVERIDSHVNKAVGALSQLRESPLKGYLCQMAESLRFVQ